MRVLVAMSGGVDSSVAAARMVDAGHDVVGVHLALSRTPSGPVGSTDVRPGGASDRTPTGRCRISMSTHRWAPP